MLFLYALVVFLAGALIALQAGINAQLARWTGHPIFAATISFLVGSAALVGCAVAVRQPWPSVPQVADAPRWIWIGGLLGAVFVYVTAALAPALGATTLLSIAIAGQMTCALVVDHLALVGFAHRPVTPGRALGVGLLVSGEVLIRQC